MGEHVDLKLGSQANARVSECMHGDFHAQLVSQGRGMSRELRVETVFVECDLDDACTTGVQARDRLADALLGVATDTVAVTSPRLQRVATGPRQHPPRLD